jgi:hypothetical protein
MEVKLKGWKITNMDMFSWLSIRRNLGVQVEAWAVQYKVGEAATPREGCGPLMVFTDLEMAKMFRKFKTTSKVDRLFECEYVPSKHKSVWFRTYEVDAADSVTLVKEIK